MGRARGLPVLGPFGDHGDCPAAMADDAARPRSLCKHRSRREGRVQQVRPGRSRAREGIAFLWICYLGRSGHELAARLGFAPVSAYRSAKRGEREGPEWCRLLHTLKATEGN